MAGRADAKKRKELIIQILMKAEGGFVSGEDIRREIGARIGKEMGKGLLSINIKELKKEGFEIESSKMYGYRYAGSLDIFIDDGLVGEYEEATADVVTEWLIMLVFAKERDRLLDLDEVKYECSELSSDIKISTVQGHLDRLAERGYLIVSFPGDGDSADISDEPVNKRYYSLAESAPVISLIDEEALADFNEYYYDRGYGSELQDVLKTINEKAAAVSPSLYTGDSGSFRAFGRKNDIPSILTEKLDEYLCLDFKKYAVNLKYKEKEKIKEYIFKTALIIFNVETNTFYLLGEIKDKGNKWVRKNFKLESVHEAGINTEVKNNIYESRKYKNLFRQMWSGAPDEPKETEVLFRDNDEIRDFVRDLKRARKETAQVSFEDGWINYRDSIIGLHDFLRIVRSLGDSAEIIKPVNNRLHMKEKTVEIIEKYRELHEKWEKKQMHSSGCQR